MVPHDPSFSCLLHRALGINYSRNSVITSIDEENADKSTQTVSTSSIYLKKKYKSIRKIDPTAINKIACMGFTSVSYYSPWIIIGLADSLPPKAAYAHALSISITILQSNFDILSV